MTFGFPKNKWTDFHKISLNAYLLLTFGFPKWIWDVVHCKYSCACNTNNPVSNWISQAGPGRLIGFYSPKLVSDQYPIIPYILDPLLTVTAIKTDDTWLFGPGPGGLIRPLVICSPLITINKSNINSTKWGKQFWIWHPKENCNYATTDLLHQTGKWPRAMHGTRT